MIKLCPQFQTYHGQDFGGVHRLKRRAHRGSKPGGGGGGGLVGWWAGVLVCWWWGSYGSSGLLGVKVSFFGGGVMDLEGCWVSRSHFLEVGSWILRAAGCQGLIFWRWGHGS